MSNMDSLPDELLISIALEHQSDTLSAQSNPFQYVPASKRTETVFSNVCRRWRLVVMSVHGLWTSVYLHQGKLLEETARYLLLSGSHPIHVVWKHEVGTPASPKYKAVLNDLISHASRWRSLCFIAGDVEVLQFMLKAMENIFAPRLEHLVGVIQEADETALSTVSQQHIFQPGIPLLRRVELSGLNLRHCYFSLDHITSFSLDRRFDIFMDTYELRILLESLPFLTTLAFRGSFIEEEWQDSEKCIDLPSLENLILESQEQWPVIFLVFIRERINAPRLERLSLLRFPVDDDDFCEYIITHDNPWSQLQTFCFRSEDYYVPGLDRHFSQALEKFREVTHVIMDGRNLEALFPAGRRPFPRMDTLTCLPATDSSAQVLREVLEARLDDGLSLSRIRVFQGFLDTAVAISTDLFQNRLQVEVLTEWDLTEYDHFGPISRI